MTLDPATLAAVRERIEALRIVGDIAKRGLSWIDARNSTVDEAIGRINVMIDSPDAEPPLTAAEVRRIAREVFAEEGLAKAVPFDGMVATAARKLLGDQSNGVGLKRPDDPPPVPPQPAVYGGTANHLTVPLDAPVPPTPPPPPKRVEAWTWESDGRRYYWHRQKPIRADAVYLTHFPGVTDAASAEAFERAIAIAWSRFDLSGLDGDDEAADALAPFLPPVPG